jgi:hypothetical protein
VPEPKPASEPEAPASKAAPAASADDSAFDLDKITRIWPAVLDHLRQSAPALAATFEGARPVAFDATEGTLKIGFPANSTFNKRKAEAPDKRELVAKALDTVTGEILRPVYVLLDGEGGAESPGAVEEIDEDALVERLKNEFNAEEVS